jgi:transposase
MDDNGNILEKTSYNNTFEDASNFAKEMILKYGQCQAVCESTGNLWLKTYEAFERNGISVKLANPLKTRLITQAQIKTDSLDSQTLAHLLRSNLVAQCYVAPGNVRDSRTILRHRESLVWSRTAIINRVHSLLDKYDLRFKSDKKI